MPSQILRNGAVRWFTAKQRQLKGLAKCNLVRVIHIDAMFEYLGKIRHLRSHKDICGFGCQIDSNQAMQWVKENRPHLYIEE